METTNFNSRDIQSTTYDDITRELYVRYSNGDYVVYYEVFPMDYVGFLSTDDHSKFLKERFDFKYDKRKLN